jgi:hypothetical protein
MHAPEELPGLAARACTARRITLNRSYLQSTDFENFLVLFERSGDLTRGASTRG